MGNIGVDEYLISNLSVYIGENDTNLKKIFGINKPSNKSTLIEIAYKMAGVSSNRVKELSDNNIVIKTIRLGKNGKIKENMSFPTIKFRELILEEWKESYIYNYFHTTKFLFILYKEMDFGYTFFGGFFWRMSYSDLNNIVMKEWEDIRSIVSTGITFEIKNKRVLNNLPNKSQTQIIHLRPKANKAAYLLKNGYSSGNIKTDGDQLPNGEWMTKQCFWLNNEYVLEQIEKESILVKCTANLASINQMQCDLLKKYLTKDFYTIEEFKNLFLSTLDLNDEKYFNAFNIDKLGYRFNFTYVYSNKYGSMNEYIESLLLSDEIVDLRIIEPKLNEINNYIGIIDSLVKELPVYRIQRNVFVNAEKLNRGGVTKEKMDLFTVGVINSNKSRYFTIRSLRKNYQLEMMFDDGFEDCFYEDILLSSNNFKSFIINNTRVFCGMDNTNKFVSFLEFIICEKKKMNIIDLYELISEYYRIDIETRTLENTLRFSNLHYDSDIEKVYINHEEFIDEVKFLSN